MKKNKLSIITLELYYEAICLWLNPNRQEILQIIKTMYDFTCLFIEWLPNIP